MSTAACAHGAQINFRDLWPDGTFNYKLNFIFMYR
jgi:hypothetical protein